MSNVSLSYPNRIYEATVTDAYSSANWLSSLPLSNVQNGPLKQVARTTTGVTSPDVTAKSGQISVTINITLPQARLVGCIALANHNLTTNATMRVIGYYNNNFTNNPTSPNGVNQFDSTQQYRAWPILYPPENGQTLFTDPNWWYGTVAADQIGAFTPLAIYYPQSGNHTCQSLKIIITDQNNASNYIQIGRIFLGQVIMPTYNPEFGDITQGYTDLTDIQRGQDGTKYFYKRQKMRTVNFTLKHLLQDEAFLGFYDAMRQVGLSGDMIYCFSQPQYMGNLNNPVDKDFYAQTFLCNFSELNPIEMPYVGFYSTVLKLEEIT
jgi:hypothetical protein